MFTHSNSRRITFCLLSLRNNVFLLGQNDKICTNRLPIRQFTSDNLSDEVKTNSLDFNMHDYSVNFKVSLTLNTEYKVRFQFTLLPYGTPCSGVGSHVPAATLDRHQSYRIHCGENFKSHVKTTN